MEIGPKDILKCIDQQQPTAPTTICKKRYQIKIKSKQLFYNCLLEPFLELHGSCLLTLSKTERFAMKNNLASHFCHF